MNVLVPLVNAYLGAWSFALANPSSRNGQGMVLGLGLATVSAFGLLYLVLWFIANGLTASRMADAQVARDPNYERLHPMNWLITGVSVVFVLVVIGLGARAAGVTW